MYTVIVTTLYCGVLTYIAHTVNARYLDWFRLKQPLSESQRNEIMDTVKELQTKVNALSIQIGMREG